MPNYRLLKTGTLLWAPPLVISKAACTRIFSFIVLLTLSPSAAFAWSLHSQYCSIDPKESTIIIGIKVNDLTIPRKSLPRKNSGSTYNPSTFIRSILKVATVLIRLEASWANMTCKFISKYWSYSWGPLLRPSWWSSSLVAFVFESDTPPYLLGHRLMGSDSA